MANRGRPTQTKRQRERKRMEKAKEKDAQRANARIRRAEAPDRPTDHDPDIAGFKAGPQEMPAWQREFFEEEQRAKEAAEKLIKQYHQRAPFQCSRLHHRTPSELRGGRLAFGAPALPAASRPKCGGHRHVGVDDAQAEP